MLSKRRSLMSLAKRGSSGSQRTRMMPRNALAGFGTSILQSLLTDARYPNTLILLQLFVEKRYLPRITTSDTLRYSTYPLIPITTYGTYVIDRPLDPNSLLRASFDFSITTIHISDLQALCWILLVKLVTMRLLGPERISYLTLSG